MKSRIGVFLVCTVLLSGGCDDRPEYDKLVEKERASGATHNELFLGYAFGMTRDLFYDHSWDLNRQGLVMQGPKNQTVLYELEKELPHPAKMFYYPDFHEEKIFQMRVRFIYDGWAPWNKDLSADSLQLHVLDLFRSWYGDGFIVYNTTKDRSGEHVLYVKVDGNRRIVVERHTESEVMAVFTDLEVEKALEGR